MSKFTSTVLEIMINITQIEITIRINIPEEHDNQMATDCNDEIYSNEGMSGVGE